MNNTQHNISIYVACLAAYNNGILHGKWIDITDSKEVWAEINEMLKSSPIPDAGKWAIHDYDGFFEVQINEHDDINFICEIASLIQEYGELAACMYNFHESIDSVQNVIYEYYAGCYNSPKDFAYDIVNELHNIPENLKFYIDYDKFLRDMEINDINIYKIGGKYHIFYQH